ncbi:MarR family winged helix-turn-helix transcriptional regulator [Phormidesmis sp. 146-33]
MVSSEVGQPTTPSNNPQGSDSQRILAPHGIGYRIKLLSQLLGRKFQERLDRFGLTPFHWVVLCCLWEEDGLATSHISDRLQQVGGTLTGVLDRMAERDLIRRERDAHDRRIWRIWLTQAGQQLQDILPPIGVELREQALQGIDYADREVLSDLLDRMIANLSSAPAADQSRRGWQEILAPYNLGYRVKLLSQLLLRHFQEKLDCFGLTPFHWVVLCCLWQEDGLATSSLGEKLQQVGGTLTGVLDRMAERDLIRRERDAHDRRIWRIWLTDAGRDLSNTLPPVAIEVCQKAMVDISTAQKEQFSQWVNQSIANLSDQV